MVKTLFPPTSISTRYDGDLRRPGATERFLRKQRQPSFIATAEQVHGNRVALVPKLPKSKKYAGVDGLLTEAALQPLVIYTADCASIFLEDRQNRVVGVLHAGWRGVHSEILKKAIQLARTKWGVLAQDVRVWLGPSIGPCCFEVKWDVARHFPLTRKRKKDRWTVDLARELRAQAKRLGLAWMGKKSLEGCTMHGSRYFSYRRDGTSKRQASIIIKKENR